MKIIDKTPLHDEKGQLSVVGRIQGTLKYGLSWASELEAQQTVIAQLTRVLDKGYVLIRNFTLPGSEVIIPMILIGPSGVTVIYVTVVKGFFEAKGDQWNTVANGVSQPAAINYLNRVSLYAKAVQKYMERHRIELASPVEAVLIAANPGAHIESMRPIARVVQSDAVKQFATAVLQARPVWRLDYAYLLADQIIDPTPPEQRQPVKPPQPEQTPGSRAQAIFNASNEAGGADDLGFSFEDEISEGQSAGTSAAAQSGGYQSPRPATSQKKKTMGMTTQQMVLLGVMLLFECCILAGFGGYFFFNP
jgi:hypothetical protein